jgi:polysaccharide biosynthesis/export protein
MNRYNCLLFMLIAVCGSVPVSGQIPLSSAVTDQQTQQTSTSGANVIPEVNMTTTVTGAHAIIGEGDLMEVTVFGIPELTQRVRVDDDGKIHLALIGDISVSGKSPAWVRDQIRETLTDGHFVKNPQVEVYIVQYSGQVAYINGEINRPGAYSLLRSHRLMDLIAVAGGLTPRAGNAATIVHNGDTKNALQVDLSVQDDARGNPEIEPGDSVNIGLTGIIYVLGNVIRPGGFLLDRRTTLTFTEALALAQGPSEYGSITNAVVLHSAQPNSQPTQVNLKMILKARSPDIQMQAGDIIWVGDSAFRNIGRLAIETILATASGVAIYSSYAH